MISLKVNYLNRAKLMKLCYPLYTIVNEIATLRNILFAFQLCAFVNYASNNHIW